MSETNSEIVDPLEIEQPDELLVDENGSTVDPDGKFNKGTSTKAEQFPLGQQSLETINSNYPSDCYSFLALHGPLEQPKFFFFGVLVWAFQVRFSIILCLLYPDVFKLKISISLHPMIIHLGFCSSGILLCTNGFEGGRRKTTERERRNG